VNPGPLFAEVVVRSPLGRRVSSWRSQDGSTASGTSLRQTFHYSIPAHLRDHVVLGQLVWVPFGPRQLAGIVLALSDSSPVAQTKDILSIIDPWPALAPYQIELMHWMSQYYHTHLHRVAWGMFPPGISWRTETMVHLEEAAAEAMSRPLSDGAMSRLPSGGATLPSREEHRILELLRQHGPMAVAQMERRLRLKRLRPLLERMVRKGWVRKQVEIRGPKVRPKTQSIVRLLAAPEEKDLEGLSRAPRQRDVLTYLRRRAEEEGTAFPLVIPVAELCAQVGVARGVVDGLVKRGLLELDQREVRRDPLAGREFVTTVPPKFTLDQEVAWQQIASALDSARSQVFLLHGVTGSGKTEIYLRALAKVLKQGGQGIALVPEIALTPQTIRRFAARFPDRLAVLHSKLSAGERYDEWRRIREGCADVVIGPRSALFAPLPRLRLVVLDEEHEWTYKQLEMPCYHARDVAVKLAELTGALVILGSATPDVGSYHRAQRGEYTLLQLPKRIMGHQRSIEEQRKRFHISARPDHVKALGAGYEDARYMDLPPVQVVDLRAELRAGNRGIFSRALQQAMEVALAAGEQVILFLNRRGAATFVMCRDCGHVMKCPGCDVPLTFHTDSDHLLCHHCNYQCSVPTCCPQCASKRIKFFGIGTQKVEQVVRKLFPRARVLRWDRDVTGSKGAHEEILTKFVNRQADVLVGTQMIAKGLDLPLVTLVGVVTADTALHLPDFRAGERTFQLLTQVAGRAGRSILGGKVIVQSYAPQHYCIQAASRHDYEGFYQREIEFRREQGYPPFNRLVRLLFTHTSAKKCEEEAEKVRHLLDSRIARLGVPDIDVIGPAPCFVARIRGRYRWQIVLRGADPTNLLEGSSLALGWRVDVDPVSLL
jgi:primosomal protein N' (replication factor Y)